MPMYGIILAFKEEFIAKSGIIGSPWAEPLFKNFTAFFDAYNFKVVFKNTIMISLYLLAASFPIPIILALMLNEVKNVWFKKLVQNATYVPHFISLVVLVGMIKLLFGYDGAVNQIGIKLGISPTNFLQIPDLFKHMYVWTGIWQDMGYSSIIYLAALSTVSTEMHEAAMIDGASRLRRIWSINLPGIMPTIVILLIMSAGQVMNIGFEKVYLMQNDVIMQQAEVLSTYVYKLGILQQNYTMASAVGLFNNIINLFLLILVNVVAKKVGETSLW